MMRILLAPLLLLALGACALGPPGDSAPLFPCRGDGDCAEAFTCDPVFAACTLAPEVLVTSPEDPGDLYPSPDARPNDGNDAQVPDDVDLPDDAEPELVLEEVFVREPGQPRWQSATFSADAGAPGLLVIRNHGCSSARVKLGGNLVLSPSALNTDVEQVEYDVTLGSQNLLQARLSSSPGCNLEVYAIALLSP